MLRVGDGWGIVLREEGIPRLRCSQTGGVDQTPRDLEIHQHLYGGDEEGTERRRGEC